MQYTLASCLLLGITGVLTVNADVTLRYSYEITPGPMLPPTVAESMKTQMPDMSARTLLKGNRALANSAGITCLTDFDGALVTLLDPKNKRYLTVQPAEYISAIVAEQEKSRAQMTPQVKAMMEQVKVEAQTRRTGRTRVIHGINAVESETTVTVSMAGAPGDMRAVIMVWLPIGEEADSHPAVRELRAYAQRSYEVADPLAALGKMSAGTPALVNVFKEFIEAVKSAGFALEMQLAVYIPDAVTLAKKMAGDKDLPPGVANAPLMQMVMRLEELSTAEIPVGVFDVPRDYSVGSMSELIAAQVPQPNRPAATKPPVQ